MKSHFDSIDQVRRREDLLNILKGVKLERDQSTSEAFSTSAYHSADRSSLVRSKLGDNVNSIVTSQLVV